PGARCAYFANQTFRSEAGLCLAHGVTEMLRSVLPSVDEPAGRTYRLLRETRMAAVMCELFSRDEPPGAALRSACGWEAGRGGGPPRIFTEANRFLDLANGEGLGDRALGQLFLKGTVGGPEQGPGVTHS